MGKHRTCCAGSNEGGSAGEEIEFAIEHLEHSDL